MKKIFLSIASAVVAVSSCFGNVVDDSVEALVKLEGSNKRNGVHVVYDDAQPKYIKGKLNPKYCWDGKSSLETFIKNCKGKPTIGYGFTGKNLVNKGFMSENESKEILRKYIISILKKIDVYVKVKLNDNQKVALVCFIYNVGSGNFAESTLLKKLNNGLYNEVPFELRRWNKTTIDGKKVVSRGLVNRRNAEIEIWNSK